MTDNAKMNPTNILDYTNPGWAEYFDEACEYVAKTGKENPGLLAEAKKGVARLGLFGLWKGYYPALYELIKIMEGAK